MYYMDRRAVTCNGPCLKSATNKGCLTPPPVSDQCSFHRDNATRLCQLWRRCSAINCNTFRSDCQARNRNYKLEYSFGDAYVYTKSQLYDGNDERQAYHRRFKSDYFLYDAMHIHDRFFKNYYYGFFVESGAFDGSVYGSNTYYFERYLGWQGLLVEASRQNYRLLQHRRSESANVQTVNTALCSFDGWANFSTASGGCCGSTGRGSNRVPCTRMQSLVHTYSVSRIDFWSLDVEGSELDVLMGFDWRVPVYVMLIESVTTTIRTLLQSHGFERVPFHSPSRLNEIWVNYAHRRV